MNVIIRSIYAIIHISVCWRCYLTTWAKRFVGNEDMKIFIDVKRRWMSILAPPNTKTPPFKKGEVVINAHSLLFPVEMEPWSDEHYTFTNEVLFSNSSFPVSIYSGTSLQKRCSLNCLPTLHQRLKKKKRLFLFL